MDRQLSAFFFCVLAAVAVSTLAEEPKQRGSVSQSAVHQDEYKDAVN